YGLLSLKNFFKSSGSLVAGNTVSLPSLSKVLLTCLGFTFLNPHVYLDTMILLGSIASAYGEPGKYFFSMGACLGSFLWFYSLGYGARLLRPIFRRPIAWKVLDLLIAVVMFFIAGTLMLDQ
ncbi:LysE/ArgO family amino acid transporter, partial [Turicimonas muris]